MKIAIFGATGLLGSNLLKRYIDDGYEVKAFVRDDFKNLDNSINKKFNNWLPDIIINAIAIVNLQKCEENEELAYKTNVLIAKQLALISKKYNSYFIQISTDHYFYDNKTKHTEKDEVVLLNNYARTKYEAEKEVLNLYNKTLVVRTNIIGFRNNNTDSFFEWLLNSIKNNNEIFLYTNFNTSPIDIYNLSSLLIKSFENKLLGIYNIASSEVIDKYSFGIKVANKFGFSTNNISQSIIKINLDTGVNRALTLGLDVTKIENALSTKMPTVDETINYLYNEYMENR